MRNIFFLLFLLFLETETISINQLTDVFILHEREGRNVAQIGAIVIGVDLLVQKVVILHRHSNVGRARVGNGGTLVLAAITRRFLTDVHIH